MSRPVASDPTESAVLEHSLPLDALLVRAAVGAGRALPLPELLTWGRRIVQRPRDSTRRISHLALQTARIGVGSAEPPPRDRRFSDPAWDTNGLYRRWVQLYFALTSAAHGLREDAALGEAADEKVRLLIDNIMSALAPSNSPLNPAAVKEAIDTGGVSIARGLRNFADDMKQTPRIPTMVDRSAFEVGRDLAVTPGAVVHRTEQFELIQYCPVTPDVHRTPILMVPPTINKFYALDLAPGRSVIEYLVAAGMQVFAISWRNPTKEHAGWGLDTYVRAVLEALAVTRSVTDSPSSSVWGTCSGGIITAVAVAHLAASGRQDEVRTLTLPVTLLDQQVSGSSGALMSPRLAEIAITRSGKQGFLDGSTLSELFAWLRPDDLVWRYWVNNYLLGRRPPAFDLLYWNADSTRMPACLHRDFIDLALHNRLTHPGSLVSNGTPIDLSQITIDAFVIGAAADHITPWQSCFQTTKLLGGATEFVLSNSGHVAALVNPPGSAKAAYQRSAGADVDTRTFMAEAERHEGSWWPAYAAWVGARSGDLVPAPETVGTAAHPPLCGAPGTYVHVR